MKVLDDIFVVIGRMGCGMKETNMKRLMIETIKEINADYERLGRPPMNREEIVKLITYAGFKIKNE